ncbi:MAG: murein biosynthesis integral membrane protein MurJ [Alphaproteobacteria bacterium]|nr:murein biosynthesis integral membrane protein MurJ [Alphaproteobacteria bacterium]
MSLARNVFVQTGFTLASRVLGFARDLALNARFGGQGPLMDAWATAQMLPNLFRRLFAEGAFAQAFVPVFAKERATEGVATADRMASQVLAFIMTVVVIFSILAEVAMPYLMPLLLSAYTDDPRTLATATLMAQLTMPYLACMTLASLLGGVLNTLGRFALAAGAPILLNLCTLVPLVLAPDPESAALFASAAVTLAGLLQGALLWWGVRKLGVDLRIGFPVLSKTVRRVVALAVPGAIAGGAIQLNTLVSQVLSGSDEGARGVLYNADRMYQLPLGLIGVAVGLALVPRLSRHFAEADEAGAGKTMDDGIGLAMAFTMPAALALLIMPFFVIDAAITRGAFSVEDARRTAEVLRQFAWGIPAFVLAKVFTPPFFARQRTRQPMQFAILAVLVNIAIGAALWFWLPTVGVDGVIGLAIGTSASGWLNVLLLAGTLAREGVYRIGAAAWRRMVRLAVACVIMGAFIALCAWQYPLLREILVSKEIAVLVVGAVGFAIYGLAMLAMGAVTLTEIRQSLRREKGAESVAKQTLMD